MGGEACGGWAPGWRSGVGNVIGAAAAAQLSDGG